MNDAQLEEFLSTSDLLGTQRGAVRIADPKMRTRV